MQGGILTPSAAGAESRRIKYNNWEEGNLNASGRSGPKWLNRKAEEAEKVREKFFVEAESVTELQRKTGNASAGEALADAVARGQGLGGQMDISV